MGAGRKVVETATFEVLLVKARNLVCSLEVAQACGRGHGGANDRGMQDRALRVAATEAADLNKLLGE